MDRHVTAWGTELPYLAPLHEAGIARLMILSRHLGGGREAALSSSGLSRASFKILLALRKLGPPYVASPSDLADHLGLTRGALSARLGPLDEAGLITRAVDRDDRRRVRVRLTAAGRRAFDRHARHENRSEAALLSALSRADLEKLAALLRRLVLEAERRDP